MVRSSRVSTTLTRVFPWKVTVAVRMRPMSAKELNEGGEICVQVLSKEAQARCEALIWVENSRYLAYMGLPQGQTSLKPSNTFRLLFRRTSSWHSVSHVS